MTKSLKSLVGSVPAVAFLWFVPLMFRDYYAGMTEAASYVAHGLCALIIGFITTGVTFWRPKDFGFAAHLSVLAFVFIVAHLFYAKPFGF